MTRIVRVDEVQAEPSDNYIFLVTMLEYRERRVFGAKVMRLDNFRYLCALSLNIPANQPLVTAMLRSLTIYRGVASAASSRSFADLAFSAGLVLAVVAFSSTTAKPEESRDTEPSTTHSRLQGILSKSMPDYDVSVEGCLLYLKKEQVCGPSAEKRSVTKVVNLEAIDSSEIDSRADIVDLPYLDEYYERQLEKIEFSAERLKLHQSTVGWGRQAARLTADDLVEAWGETATENAAKHQYCDKATLPLGDIAMRSGVEAHDLICADTRDLPVVLPQSVDFVLLANSLHRVPDPTAVARTIASVLKPGSHVTIIDWRPIPREQTIVLGKPRGPNTAMRMSPEEVEYAVYPADLDLGEVIDLSPYHYGAVFWFNGPKPEAVKAMERMFEAGNVDPDIYVCEDTDVPVEQQRADAEAMLRERQHDWWSWNTPDLLEWAGVLPEEEEDEDEGEADGDE